ncbi:HTH domain-containing protein [Archaeoglobus profundus]|uniref:Uncharacterized protein n=1 Tax=Archaeoglobus profundus (strain DSM 5631 / JCM 9629 / NBRC 100127 / Av18) TaxID=572546 RepID=D2RGU3_ARCPA|nr:HTH domain-containing protein [Archaeoglobus profundus]ADB57518.1 hypothetical protein Arcpr_0452 [Archaeoglobus profundus DSM 5631]
MAIGLKPLEDIVELAIISAWIKPKPVSLGIFAPPEYGKTEALLQFAGCKGVKIISDVTSFGLSRFILPEISSKRVKCLIFPDLLKILNRSWKVTNEILSLLNVIIEEGVSAVYTFNIQFDAEIIGDRVRCGVILACPEEVIKERENRLKKFGFWSRILPFYFEYTKEDLLRIHEEIKEERSPFMKKNLNIPDDEIEIKLPKEEADKLDPIVFAFKDSIGSTTGFRLRWNLQQLAKANAWINDRDIVIEEDIRKIISFTPFFFNPIKGDECIYRILRLLPAKSEEIVEELSDLYSRRTIYDRLKRLKESGIIIESERGWNLRLK